jgi:hypothetical protein
VVARPCVGRWVLVFSGIICVAPLRLGWLRGKKITPRVSWEVSVRSHRLASGSWKESAQDNDFQAFYGTYVYICIELQFKYCSRAFTNVLLLC